MEISRFFTSSDKEEPNISNRSWTAVATLLTFCPPGPDARINSSCNSRSSIFIEGVISSILKPLSRWEREGVRESLPLKHQSVDFVNHIGSRPQVCFLEP